MFCDRESPGYVRGLSLFFIDTRDDLLHSSPDSPMEAYLFGDSTIR